MPGEERESKLWFSERALLKRAVAGDSAVHPAIVRDVVRRLGRIRARAEKAEREAAEWRGKYELACRMEAGVRTRADQAEAREALERKLTLDTDDLLADAWGALNALEWMDADGPGLSEQSRSFAESLRAALSNPPTSEEN